jgi:hypothetical protein
MSRGWCCHRFLKENAVARSSAVQSKVSRPRDSAQNIMSWRSGGSPRKNLPDFVQFAVGNDALVSGATSDTATP